MIALALHLPTRIARCKEAASGCRGQTLTAVSTQTASKVFVA